MKNFTLLALFFSGSLHILVAQADLIINTEGVPPITNYVGTDYNGFNQVWDVIQDERGLIYLAETYNIIEFDGNEWRKTPLPNGVIPRCFAKTWWAYLSYLLFFVGFIRLVIILNSKRLIAENDRLEEVIKGRLEEIQEQKGVIAQSLKEKESLLKEIHHRVKNNLQIIANLLYLQSGKFDDENIKNILEEGQGRVRSMALIHQKLYENEDLKSIPFGEYVLELVNESKTYFGDQAANVKIKVAAEEAFFDVDSAVPLGLIINELSTNAFKYAFDGSEGGLFSIFLTKSGNDYELHVSDNGKGLPEEIDIRKTRSLGLRLVRILSEQLEGEYYFDSNEGMSFKLKFAA